MDRLGDCWLSSWWEENRDGTQYSQWYQEPDEKTSRKVVYRTWGV